MKRIIYIGFLLLITSFCFAQQEMELIRKSIKDIPYVFEGIIESVEIYPGDSLGNRLNERAIKKTSYGEECYMLPSGNLAVAYSIVTIKLCKVYKGKAIEQEEKVQIVTSSNYLGIYRNAEGDDWYRYNPPTHFSELFLWRPIKGERLFFFCEENNNKLTLYGNHSIGLGYNHNYEVENKVGGNEGKIVYAYFTYNHQDKPYSRTKNLAFYSEKEFLRFFNSIPTLNHKAKDKCELEKKKIIGLNDSSVQKVNNINYQQNLANYNSWLQNTLSKQNNKIANSEHKTLSTDLELQIANDRMVNIGGSNWLEFDVLVSSNTTTYFDNCLMRITYATPAFNSNIVSSGNIQIIRAPSFNNNTYSIPQADVIDQNNSTIGLPFGTSSTFTLLNRTQIKPTPQVMLTIRFKINTCSQYSNVNFTDISFTPMFSYYASNANNTVTNTTSFDNTSSIGYINEKMCDPVIVGFNPNIPGGINTTLTISGKYFGNVTGTVIFKNADRGHVDPTLGLPHDGGVQPYDIISWTDTEIKVNVPSVIDSVRISPNVANYETITPGSGRFKVKNKLNKVTESISSVTMPYSIWNGIYSTNGVYFKLPVNLSSPNTTHGYIVHLHPSIDATYPLARAIIKKAMKNWNCATGINWRLGSDTNLISNGDDVCTISLKPFDPLTGVLATTARREGYCPSTEIYSQKAFDIQICHPLASGKSWQFDTLNNSIQTNQYDFYDVISHELGHAHALQHVNDSLGDLMFCSVNEGAYNASQRKTVMSSFDAITGGTYVTNSLINPIGCGVYQHQISTPTNCTASNTSVNQLGYEFLNAQIYPNPSALNEVVNISFELSKEENVWLEIIDITGKQLLATTSENKQSINYELKTDNFSQGLYLLKIHVGNKQQTFKLVKK